MRRHHNHHLAQLALVLNVAWMLSGRCATAAEPTPSVEQLAIAIDSANGLLAARQQQKFLGARSCAASACHGGIEPDPRFPLSRLNEYVHWLDKDPHARSFQTLHNDLSKSILRRLERPSDDDSIRARRLANCYGCHNPQPDKSAQSETFYERDSVSCELCHGAAEQWIGPHVTQAWPSLKRNGDASALGFVTTEDVTIRAQSCVPCHVGSPGREVNHDLIAAGHPALKFELTAYYAMLPKHWRDAEERKSNPRLELELWKAGQVACAEAAVELLVSRAKRALNEETGAIWPEFAEYDCYSCHHDLVHPSWRQTNATSSTPLGMPAWGSWYLSRFRHPFDENLQRLTNHMQKSLRPDPKSVAISGVLVQFADPPNEALADVPIVMPANWDDATQQYLALIATYHAQRDAGTQDDSEVNASITRLREQLAFPVDYDSPRGLFEPGDAAVTRDQVHQSLLDLMNQLQPRREN